MGGAFFAIPIKHFDTDDGYRAYLSSLAAPPILRQGQRSLTKHHTQMSYTQKNFHPPLDTFSRHNESKLSFASSKDAICICMQISRDALQDAITNGCNTVRALSAHTGAGTMCGGCVATMAVMTGEQMWQPAVCTQVVARTPQVKSFRFKTNGPQHALIAQPGQHVMLKATIAGVEVCRRYTVTAHASVANNAVYEITVLRQAHGVMSNWLFNHMRLNKAIDIALPSGKSRFTITGKRPLVFLVGGIGVTPALAFCRAHLGAPSARPIHVDYSVSTDTEAVCAEELAYLSARLSTLTFSLRITSEQGRLKVEDIRRLATQYTDADWFICGTRSFEHDVRAMLIAAEISTNNVHAESFNAQPVLFSEVRESTSNLTAWLSPAQRTMTGSLVLLAVTAFAIQAIAGLQWTALTALQSNTAIKIFSGLLLAVLFVVQGQLGLVRAGNDKSSTARAYGKHILLGPLPLAALWLHSTTLGTALTFWLTTCLLASLATGAVIGMRPRSSGWENTRKWILGGHIFLSCTTCSLGMIHGLIAVWF
jgi:ferredoxin-NADP reductase